MISLEASPARPSDPILLLGGCERRLLLGICRIEPGSRPRVLAAQQWESQGRMSEILGPALDQMLKLQKMAPDDLGGVACLHGPGSFTGLRIVLAFAEGFCLPRRLPRAGLSHLEALARSVEARVSERTVVLAHARTRQVNAQEFLGLSPTGDPVLLDLDGALDLALRGDPGRTTVLGSGLRRNPSLAAELADRGVPALDERFDEPDIQAVAAMAAEASYADAPLQALYLRESDAEENLERIAETRGLSPDEARRLLDSARPSRT